jgi:hypothetical protein
MANREENEEREESSSRFGAYLFVYSFIFTRSNIFSLWM